jgi:hypothetical protein
MTPEIMIKKREWEKREDVYRNIKFLMSLMNVKISID